MGDPPAARRPGRPRRGPVGADGHRGERGLGSILVHHLGASQRWRIGLETQGTDQGPEPEREPLLAIDELRERWEAEWVAVDAWLPTLTDGFVQYVHEGCPFGRC